MDHDGERESEEVGIREALSTLWHTKSYVQHLDMCVLHTHTHTCPPTYSTFPQIRNGTEKNN